jgi:hypothetical protein
MLYCLLEDEANANVVDRVVVVALLKLRGSIVRSADAMVVDDKEMYWINRFSVVETAARWEMRSYVWREGKSVDKANGASRVIL